MQRYTTSKFLSNKTWSKSVEGLAKINNTATNKAVKTGIKQLSNCMHELYHGRSDAACRLNSKLIEQRIRRFIWKNISFDDNFSAIILT